LFKRDKFIAAGKKLLEKKDQILVAKLKAAWEKFNGARMVGGAGAPAGS